MLPVLFTFSSSNEAALDLRGSLIARTRSKSELDFRFHFWGLKNEEWRVAPHIFKDKVNVFGSNFGFVHFVIPIISMTAVAILFLNSLDDALSSSSGFIMTAASSNTAGVTAFFKTCNSSNL